MVSNPPAALKLSPVPVLGGEKGGLDKPVEHRTLKQKRHGREYSLQLKATDKPVNHHVDVVVVVEGEEEEKEGQMIAGAEEQVSVDGLEAAKTEAEADFEVSPKRLSRTRPPPPSPHDPNLLSPLDAKQVARQHQQHQQQQHQHQHHYQSDKPISAFYSERDFARQFGYSPQSSPTKVTFFSTSSLEDPSSPTTPTRKRRSCIKKGRAVTIDEDEEGTLVLLPPPPLLRPYSFWRNTSRSALHTPSFHLIRRSRFIAAGLSFENPVCDLSISAVEGRITIGKLKGLSGGAGISNSWDIFAC